jgi:sulfur relay (sulfurtransferase) complex TusBCD TusD component (DsrE family)
MEARGVRQEDLAEGVQRGTLDELAEWTEDADKGAGVVTCAGEYFAKIRY